MAWLASPVATLVLAVALAWPCAALADAKQDARTTFELGVEASRAQRWEEARAQFRRSLELLPKASTMFNLAVADIKLGLGREALEQLSAFERAATQEEHSAMVERAQVLRPQAQALVDSEKATAQHGGNVLSRSEDGLSDEARKDVEQAREDYARGRDREALTGFERAYKSSKRPELLYNIGVVADRLRDDRRAARAYERFVDALPDAPEAAVAQVRSEALRAALEKRAEEPFEANAGRFQGERRDTALVNPPNLVGPRAMLVAGPLVAAGSAAVLGWLVGKQLPSYKKCLGSVRPDAADSDPEDSAAPRGGNEAVQLCTNPDEITKARNQAKIGAAAAGVMAAVGVGVTVVGAVLLVKRKHAGEQARVSLTPMFAIGHEQVAGLVFRARF